MSTGTRRRDDSREIRAQLQAKVKSVVAALIPGALDRKWCTGRMTQPPLPGRRSGSFTIWLDAERAGGWKDYGGSQEQGDIIDLINYVHGKPRHDGFAFKWARDFLGLSTMTPAERQAAAAVAQAAAAKAQRRASEIRAGRARRAFNMFIDGMPLAEGQLAWIYLAGRQVAPDLVPHLEARSFRFRPKLEWWKGAEYDAQGRKIAWGPEFPALVSSIVDRDGHVTGVHCTFLERTGQGKAPVDRPKLMFGDVEGGVIRVSRGPSGLTVEEHAAAGAEANPLIITEGIEDALTLAIEIPEARVWAATSLGNLMHVPVDLPCVSRVIVAADNDWAAPQAAEQLERALDVIRLADKPVEVMRPPAPFKDFNDWIRGKSS